MDIWSSLLTGYLRDQGPEQRRFKVLCCALHIPSSAVRVPMFLDDCDHQLLTKAGVHGFVSFLEMPPDCTPAGALMNQAGLRRRFMSAR